MRYPAAKPIDQFPCVLGESIYDGLRTWATEIQARTHHNKAACALANKLARVCYAVLRDHTPFGSPQPRQEKKLTRTVFAIAA
jgi:hypothetical protein